jgi:hypothetical protein
LATGVVIAVEGDGPADVTGFSLRTPDGVVIQFDVGRLDVSAGGLPAPHLREHLVDGTPIVVAYRIEDGRHIAVRYHDAE